MQTLLPGEKRPWQTQYLTNDLTLYIFLLYILRGGNQILLQLIFYLIYLCINTTLFWQWKITQRKLKVYINLTVLASIFFCHMEIQSSTLNIYLSKFDRLISCKNKERIIFFLKFWSIFTYEKFIYLSDIVESFIHSITWYAYTVCPRGSDPFYILTCYIK